MQPLATSQLWDSHPWYGKLVLDTPSTATRQARCETGARKWPEMRMHPWRTVSACAGLCCMSSCSCGSTASHRLAPCRLITNASSTAALLFRTHAARASLTARHVIAHIGCISTCCWCSLTHCRGGMGPQMHSHYANCRQRA